ncbi:ImmA/IrrE family metallo-endopeptidase [Bacillus halotolerans]|uniref:ImmA/IrrE family metallo-endopeptidase n=1 Tax=Bacillus halotolerans TaxID=260554 RepID=A0ABY7I588_9BACI|nr:ImmA/IrrE family metallo-endopeptidase [Bacillus halotolerans]MDG0765417.1 ImmA/IrrE family metallo-endopeptidase [Bacillus halotolerans]WAT23137.1 ImmA/IrrE family metallo-endopeptidase [Bacillus halotolerans]
MSYESLLIESEDTVTVFEKKLSRRIKGLYSDGIVWINKKLSNTEKRVVLAEELGHHFTTAGQILDQSTIQNRKQELRARNWAYKKLVPLNKIVQAHKAGIKNRYELAEFLNVTEKFLDEALKRYIEEYGLYKEVNGLTICFQPLGVIEMFETFQS